MAKKRKTTKKTAERKAAKNPEVTRVEVQADAEMMRGRYANYMRVSLQDEEFVLDFLARAGEQTTLVSRVFITPQHGQRILDVLRRQVAVYRKLQREKAKKR